MNREFLKHLFTEGIYVVPGEEVESTILTQAAPVANPVQEEINPAYIPRDEKSLQQIVAENNKAEELRAAGIEPEPNPVASVPSYEIEGNYQRKVLVLTEQLDSVTKELLFKILGAVKLTLDDVALIDCKRQKLNLEELKEQLKPSYVIAFGMENYLVTSLQVTNYIGQQSGKTALLFADSLSLIEGSKELKTKLWSALKQIFS